MSTDDEDKLPEDGDAAFDENDVADDESNAAETEEPEARPRRNLLGIGALLLSIIALGGVGLLLWNDYREADAIENSEDSVSRLEARIEASRETIVSLKDSLSEQSETSSALRQRVSSLEDTLDEPATLLGSLPSRVAALERDLASLQGVSTGTRDNWLLAEAEYYLQIANAQAELAGNPDLAAAALAQADERLADLSNPAFTDVRSEIANEKAALEIMTEVDVPGLTMTLASLARVVDSLPVRMNDRELGGEAEAGLDEDLGGLDRAWASVKDAMTGLVKVSKPGEDGSPLLSPDAAVLLRANLALQLQAARLALLKGERTVFEQSLLDAENWIMTYFDTDSVQVLSALETITEVRNSPVMDAMPDVSGSLNRLRQLRTLEESRQ